jgi:hypothetical protein
MENVLHSNRDLYLFIVDLAERHRRGGRSLEEYLRALQGAAAERKGESAVSLSDFGQLLEAAFTRAPARFDPAWADAPRHEETAGHRRWEQLIRAQIVDLHEMDRAGTLRDEMRYFGISSPRGSRWYNFDPATFLECGAAGSLGGWEEGDPGGRGYVPGPVAVLDGNGGITSVDPRSLVEPIVTIDRLTWEQLTEFLGAGQCYE